MTPKVESLARTPSAAKKVRLELQQALKRHASHLKTLGPGSDPVALPYILNLEVSLTPLAVVQQIGETQPTTERFTVWFR